MNEELAALAEAYLQNELDDAGRQQLLQRLEADPIAAATFITVLREHRMVDAWYHQPDASALADRVQRSLNMNRESQIQRRSDAVRDRIAHLPKRRKRRARTIRWPGLLTAAAALLVCVIGYWRWPTQEAGPVWVATIDSDQPLQINGQPQHGRLQLEADTLIECDERVSLRYVDGSIAQFAGRLRLQADGGLLESGSINCSIEKQQPGKQFSIETRDGRVSVLGTRFTVTVRDDSLLEVREGLVEVENTLGSTARIGAGMDARFHRDRKNIDVSVSTGSWQPAANYSSWRSNGVAPYQVLDGAVVYQLNNPGEDLWRSRWFYGPPVKHEATAALRLEVEFDWPGAKAANGKGQLSRATVGAALVFDEEIDASNPNEGQARGFVRIGMSGDRLHLTMDRKSERIIDEDIGKPAKVGIHRLTITLVGDQLSCEVDDRRVVDQRIPLKASNLRAAIECGSRDFGPLELRILRFRCNRP